MCAARGGKVYLIDEAPIIPAHPRCRCIYAGVVELSNEDVEVDGPAADAAFEAAQQQKKLQKAAGSGIIDAERIVAEAKTSGGRHHGKYMDAMTWEEKSVKKSIRSYEKTAEEHWEKIANPAKYDIGWEEKDTVQRNGLLRKWEKDAIRNREIAEVMRSVAKERGIEIK